MLPIIDVILPCLDEAAALPWVLSHLPAQAQAIVVDNGCTDRSAEIAQRLGATVITCEARGYGAACHAGLMAARSPIVAFCDCDGTLDPTEALRFAEALDDGADLVVGRRRPVSRAAWSRSARVANYELARRIRARTGLRIQDVGPLRVARREDLVSLDIRDRRSGYPVETILRAAQAGWRIDQLDVQYRPRIGQSKVTGTVRGSVQAVRDIREVLRR
jgi:glycosyltransferase involved in cell wall biosynthesis